LDGGLLVPRSTTTSVEGITKAASQGGGGEAKESKIVKELLAS